MKGREIILFTKTRMYLYCFFFFLYQSYTAQKVYIATQGKKNKSFYYYLNVITFNIDSHFPLLYSFQNVTTLLYLYLYIHCI